MSEEGCRTDSAAGTRVRSPLSRLRGRRSAGVERECESPCVIGGATSWLGSTSSPSIAIDRALRRADEARSRQVIRRSDEQRGRDHTHACRSSLRALSFIESAITYNKSPQTPAINAARTHPTRTNDPRPIESSTNNDKHPTQKPPQTRAHREPRSSQRKPMTNARTRVDTLAGSAERNPTGVIPGVIAERSGPDRRLE